MIRILPILLILVLPKLSFSQSPSKVMGELRSGNYDQAWEYIQKLRKKQNKPILKAFATAQFFFIKENPQRDLDSAHLYTNTVQEFLPLDLSNKYNRKLAAEGIREYYVDILEAKINAEAFQVAKDSNTVQAFEHFLSLYQNASYYDEALAIRNELAYQEASSTLDYRSLKNFIDTYEDAEQVEEAKAMYEYLLYRSVTADSSYQAFAEYIETYPNGAYVEEAQTNYDLRLYQTKTKTGSLEAYSLFVNEFPKSPYRGKAEDMIYQIMSNEKIPENLVEFVTQYPDNRNNSEAWLLLYELSTVSASDSAYLAFQKQFPDFPYPELLEKDLALSRINPVRYRKGDKLGYVDTLAGDTITLAWFYEASPFSQGLAYVSEMPCENGCQYGYINKAGEMIIPAQFDYASDFHEGFAVVGIGNCDQEDCKYGIIDKKGIYLVPPKYDDAYPFSGGYALVGIAGKGYAFINKQGETQLGPELLDAKPFGSGLAPIKLDSLWYYINSNGIKSIAQGFKRAGSFSHGLAAVSQDGETYYYIDIDNKTVIEGPFTQASDFSNGTAEVSKVNEKGQRETFYINLEGERLNKD